MRPCRFVFNSPVTPYLLVFGLLGAWILFTVILVFVEGRNEPLVRVTAKPELVASADEFRTKARGLQPDDVIDVNTSTFVVRENEFRIGLLTVEGPGPSSSPGYKARRPLNTSHLWFEIANGRSNVSIIRKGDPGWQENATWFHLQ